MPSVLPPANGFVIQDGTAKGGNILVDDHDFSNTRTCAQITVPPKAKPLGSEVIDNRKLWPNGTTLSVKVIGASPFVAAKIQQWANVWSTYANILFIFITSGDADIRVTVTPNIGSWSVIGTDARNRGQDQPTMNFGWFNDQTADAEFSRVVTHEFGHAIGCLHEQQSPNAHIPWNKPAAYAYFEKTQGWTAAQVDAQIFTPFDPLTTTETAFDRTSIMWVAMIQT